MKVIVKSDTFRIFDLYGHKLLVNISKSILSLLLDDQVLAQCVLSEAEMRILLPLLDSHSCCEQEVLRASFFCTEKVFLQVFAGTGTGAPVLWEKLVREQRDILASASKKNARREKMLNVYNVLYGLRQKLGQFGFRIRVSRDGYYISLKE